MDEYELTRRAQAAGYPNWQTHLHALRMAAKRDECKTQRERYALHQRELMKAASPPIICRPVPRGV